MSANVFEPKPWAPGDVIFEAVLRGGPDYGPGFDALRREIRYAWPEMPPAQVFVHMLDERQLDSKLWAPTTDSIGPSLTVPVRKYAFGIERVEARYRYLGELVDERYVP